MNSDESENVGCFGAILVMLYLPLVLLGGLEGMHFLIKILELGVPNAIRWHVNDSAFNNPAMWRAIGLLVAVTIIYATSRYLNNRHWERTLKRASETLNTDRSHLREKATIEMFSQFSDLDSALARVESSNLSHEIKLEMADTLKDHFKSNE